MTQARIYRLVVLPALAAAVLWGCNATTPPTTETPNGQTDTPSSGVQKPQAFMQLIEFHDDIQGVRNWAYELEQRGLKSLINVRMDLVTANPDDIRWLADHGHEIMGGHSGGTLWDVPYEEQLQSMQDAKQLIEGVTGRPMRVFSSTYFAYDENTRKAADAAGIEFVLARGIGDVEALIYEPDEYNCRIISVSNVTFADMGRGSLCDYSLYARGATGADFAQILEDTLDKHPKRVMVVSHAYLGGMKKDWWEPYEALLDSDELEWVASFDEWVKSEYGVNIGVPYSMVPDNREVKYETPTPAVPLDELEDVDDMYNPCVIP